MANVPQMMATADATPHAARPVSTNQLIFRAIVGVASGTLLLRLFGMLNQIVISARFGAGATMDAFIVASSLPTVAASIVTTALEYSIAPVYARVRAQGGLAQSSRLFSTLATVFLLGAGLCTLVALLFRREVLFLVAPALDPARMALAVELAPIVFPVFLLAVLLGVVQCVLNMEGRFGWPTYAGILVPLATIALVLRVPANAGIVVLCIGALVGACLQLFVVALCLQRTQLRYRLTIDVGNSDVRSVLVVGWPVLLGALVVQASGIIDQVFASFLSAGSISAAVGRAALPFLSPQAAVDDMRGFKATLRLYLWLVMVLTLAFSVLLLVLAHPVVRILFERGAFSATDVDRTATTLQGFAFGLAPMGAIILLEKAVSALRRTRVLMYTGILTVTLNALLDYVFAHFWQSFGIALATSAVYACSMTALLLALHSRLGWLNLVTPPEEVVNALRRARRRLWS